MLHQSQADAPGAITEALRMIIGSISEELCCPITTELLRDPVVALDGMTYERTQITRWFEEHRRSPLTNEVLRRNDLTPNHLAKGLVQKLLQLKADCEANAIHENRRNVTNASQ